MISPCSCSPIGVVFSWCSGSDERLHVSLSHGLDEEPDVEGVTGVIDLLTGVTDLLFIESTTDTLLLSSLCLALSFLASLLAGEHSFFPRTRAGGFLTSPSRKCLEQILV